MSRKTEIDLYVLSTHFVAPISWLATVKKDEHFVKYLSEHPEKGDTLIDDNSRTPGVFTSFEEAEEVIKNNYGDINEANYYNLAVIEKIKPGLYPLAYDEKDRWFYEIHSEGRGDTYKYTWKKLDGVPECFKGVVGLGIG